MNQNLANWYRQLRRFNAARDAFNIAKRLAAMNCLSCDAALALVGQRDFDYMLKTARVDYSR